ncbi:hypothetical protein RUM44_010148 [Polyplax serrata]|uniref:Uncharacterized protein n=1 Tax=Polyplax serrata TaxID=468196 RepID=A0ABR1AUR5_POLSC
MDVIDFSSREARARLRKLLDGKQPVPIILCFPDRVNDVYRARDLKSTEENLITEMLEKFKGVNDGVNSEANTNNNRSNTTNVKPPTLELPRFDEKIAEWTTFCDLLIAAIHNN